MKEETKISWADYTFNPWIGCMKVTDGCKNCYAETMNKRFNGGKNWGPDSERRITTIQNWNKIVRLNRECKELGIRKVVFCASLADVFEDNGQVFEARTRLWELIEQCDSLDWLLLTKRPENIVNFVPMRWLEKWPGNVMPGTSVCSDNDIKFINIIGEASFHYKFKYFLSMEPLLGMPPPLSKMFRSPDLVKDYAPYSIIVGGESGPGARPMHPIWIKKIKSDCEDLGIVFHFKQWGEWSDVCNDLEVLNQKHLYINYKGETKPQLFEDDQPTHWTKMIRYGVKNTGNRLDGENYMPKVFFQNPTPVF